MCTRRTRMPSTHMQNTHLSPARLGGEHIFVSMNEISAWGRKWVLTNLGLVNPQCARARDTTLHQKIRLNLPDLPACIESVAAVGRTVTVAAAAYAWQAYLDSAGTRNPAVLVQQHGGLLRSRTQAKPPSIRTTLPQSVRIGTAAATTSPL